MNYEICILLNGNGNEELVNLELQIGEGVDSGCTTNKFNIIFTHFVINIKRDTKFKNIKSDKIIQNYEKYPQKNII